MSRHDDRDGYNETNFHAQVSDFVFVTTERCATWDMEASASPRKPYVVMRERSENVDNFEVVNRSARIGKSDFYKCESSDMVLSCK